MIPDRVSASLGDHHCRTLFQGQNSHALSSVEAKTARPHASDYPKLGVGPTQGPSSFVSSWPSKNASEPMNRHLSDSRPRQEDE